MFKYTRTPKTFGGGEERNLTSQKIRNFLVSACLICASSIEVNANTLGENSAYALTDAQSASNKTITMYSYDNALNSEYKTLTLTTTTFGNSSGTNSTTKKD